MDVQLSAAADGAITRGHGRGASKNSSLLVGVIFWDPDAKLDPLVPCRGTAAAVASPGDEGEVDMPEMSLKDMLEMPVLEGRTGGRALCCSLCSAR